jgi:hypothetical protein
LGVILCGSNLRVDRRMSHYGVRTRIDVNSRRHATHKNIFIYFLVVAGGGAPPLGIDIIKEINIKLYLNGQDIQKTSTCDLLKVTCV